MVDLETCQYYPQDVLVYLWYSPIFPPTAKSFPFLIV